MILRKIRNSGVKKIKMQIKFKTITDDSHVVWDVSKQNIVVLLRLVFLVNKKTMVFSHIEYKRNGIFFRSSLCVSPYNYNRFRKSELRQVLDSIREACENPREYWASALASYAFSKVIRVDNSRKWYAVAPEIYD